MAKRVKKPTDAPFVAMLIDDQVVVLDYLNVSILSFPQFDTQLTNDFRKQSTALEYFINLTKNY